MGHSRIGNRKHAEAALNGIDMTDEDWSLFGGGSMRDVWHHKPSDVVYKVDANCYKGYNNKAELANIRRLEKMGWKHLIIPKATGWHFGKDVVVAMEYIEGVSPWGLTYEEQSKFFDAHAELGDLGLTDMHSGNYLYVMPNKIAPVDLGSPQSLRRRRR